LSTVLSYFTCLILGKKRLLKGDIKRKREIGPIIEWNDEIRYAISREAVSYAFKTQQHAL
jgi:hypothetical protein